jgi:hypothetical protein
MLADFWRWRIDCCTVEGTTTNTWETGDPTTNDGLIRSQTIDGH